MKPCDSPTARQFLFQCLVTRPIFIFRCRAGRVRIEQSQVFAQLLLRLIRRAELRAVDIAIAEALGERNLPRPAVLHGGGDGLRRHGVADRRRHGDRRVVEQILREADVGRLQRLRDQQSREARAVDEQVGGDASALPGAHRGDGALLIEVGVGHVRGLIANAALRALSCAGTGPAARRRSDSRARCRTGSARPVSARGAWPRAARR